MSDLSVLNIGKCIVTANRPTGGAAARAKEKRTKAKFGWFIDTIPLFTN